MAPEQKPETAAGYRREETEQVEAACLTVATVLGDLTDEICIVGGLVPSMLIDRASDVDETDQPPHCGTNDLDVGLSAVLMDGERYAEVSRRLREAGFRNDETEAGRPTRQRWRLGTLKVTIDFLIAPLSEDKEGGDLQDLEADFAAIVAPGLQLAFDEQVPIRLDGRDLHGDRASREVWICGPGAFTVLKAHAFRRRGLGKDAYDLVYVLRRWPDGIDDVASRVAAHAGSEPDTVRQALGFLAEDFATIDHVRPRGRPGLTLARTKTRWPPMPTVRSTTSCPLANASASGPSELVDSSRGRLALRLALGVSWFHSWFQFERNSGHLSRSNRCKERRFIPANPESSV